MGKSKRDLMNEMEATIKEMRPTMNEAKVKPVALPIPPGSDIISIELIREAHKWIKDIYEKQYNEVLKMKNLLPTETWEQYELYGGFEDHEEVVLLRNAMKAFRKVIVARAKPDFFIRRNLDGLIKKAKKNSRDSK